MGPKKLNEYRVTVKEYAVGRSPKRFIVVARNIKDARKIANKRIKIKRIR